jgi:hypothetical protein
MAFQMETYSTRKKINAERVSSTKYHPLNILNFLAFTFTAIEKISYRLCTR